VLGTNNQWYCLMPNGDLRRWMGNAAATLAQTALVANLATAVYSDPTELWTAAATGNPNATFALSGNQLTIRCDPSFMGSFTVQVTASDGIANVSQSFNVSVTRRGAVLSSIANQTMSHAQKTLSVNLPVSNPDNDALSFSARALAPSQQAYNLEQTLGLTYTGNYWTNFYGDAEKWLLASGAGSARGWFCLLPNGELRRAGNSLADMLAASSLVATLDGTFYQDPSLLWNAQPPVTPSVSFAFSGNRMTVTPAANVAGTFAVQVTMSAGQVNVSQTFNLTVTNSAPVLGAIANQSVLRGKSLTVNLAVSDPDGDALTWSFQTATPSRQALNLQQSLGLSFSGNYWTNYYGLGENWLKGAASGSASGFQWFCLLPNGVLRRAGTGPTDMMAAASLVGTLDPNYYVDPSLLWNARNYVEPQVAYSLSGNQLTITPPSYVGTFVVQVTVRDGFATVKQSFAVTVRA
jgi:hypothetical protein